MKRNAFTLVEMLTVVAITAALAALLLTGLGGARAQALAASCRNNLGQIAKALALYAADFRQYPGTRDLPSGIPPSGADDWKDIWNCRLLPYVSAGRSVFLCPLDPTPHVLPHFSLTNYSYGYNAYGSGVPPSTLKLGLGHIQSPGSETSTVILAVTDAQIIAPSDMIAVGDLNDLYSVFTVTIWPVSSAPFAGGPAARHSGGANMVFCDGHAEFAKQKNWIEETDLARRRWNNDHEAHRETW